jgi:Luciferase-like monooxygenase
MLAGHVGGSSRAAARRAGRRGDGYFPGGGLSAAERASQVELMRETAREAGRDAAALEYTRWESMGMPAADVGNLAGPGVTRVVVPAASRTSTSSARKCPRSRRGWGWPEPRSTLRRAGPSGDGAHAPPVPFPDHNFPATNTAESP